MKRILVVGSLNMDIVIETPCMPKAGETIAGKSIAQIPGGKGANQAFAAGKLGGNIAMMGAVGNDEKGEKLLESLKGVGVDISRIEVMNDIPTGQAFITVDDQGENAIIIIAGANGKVTKELIDSNLALIKQSDIIIMQLEIPLEIVGYVKKIVEEDGKIVILDPAPAIKDIPENMEVKNRKDITEAAKILIKKGVKNVIVTMGGDGCLYINKDIEEFFPAYPVKAIDTTAAGDCFTAAFALALSQNKNWKEAIEFGQKASSIAVTRKGAQTSIPTREEVDEMKGGKM